MLRTVIPHVYLRRWCGNLGLTQKIPILINVPMGWFESVMRNMHRDNEWTKLPGNGPSNTATTKRSLLQWLASKCLSMIVTMIMTVLFS